MFNLLAEYGTQGPTESWPAAAKLAYLAIHVLLMIACGSVSVVSIRVLIEQQVFERGIRVLLFFYCLAAGGFAAIEATRIWCVAYGDVSWQWQLLVHLFTAMTAVPSAFMTVVYVIPYAVKLINATRLRMDVRVEARKLRTYAEHEANIDSPVVTDTGSVSDDIVGELARTKIAIHRITNREKEGPVDGD